MMDARTRRIVGQLRGASDALLACYEDGADTAAAQNGAAYLAHHIAELVRSLENAGELG